MQNSTPPSLDLYLEEQRATVQLQWIITFNVQDGQNSSLLQRQKLMTYANWDKTDIQTKIKFLIKFKITSVATDFTIYKGP